MSDLKIDEKLKSFLNDIEKVCKSHNICIGHEDRHGGFLFSEYNEEYMGWLKEGDWDFCPKYFSFSGEEKC
jgi:hypothetical protein